MNKLIILDRDGVINQDSYHYIKSPEECILIPGSIDAIAKLTVAGYRIGIATNQSGVARGLYTLQELAAIHQKLLTAVEDAGGRIEIIKYCQHMPDAGCSCRKPQPGMLLEIGKYFDCSLIGVPYVGDRISDIVVAMAVGAKPMIVLSMMTEQAELNKYPHVPVFSSLYECVNTLLRSDE